MTMTPEEKLNSEIWSILQEIRKEELLFRPDGLKTGTLITDLVMETKAALPFEGSDLSPRLQLKILEHLRGTGAISLDYKRYMLNSPLGGPMEVGPIDDDFMMPINGTTPLYENRITITVLRPKFDEVYKEFESTFKAIKHYTHEKTEIMTANEIEREVEGLQKGLSESLKSGGLSAADKKKLAVLEKLKTKWELTPKAGQKPIMIQAGVYGYMRPAGEAWISQKEVHAFINECGLSDYYELEGILSIFMEEGLITDFENRNEYE